MAIALVVSAWLGAALLVAASVAPAAFAVLPTRELAGALVGRVLPALFIAGLVAGLLAAAADSGARRIAALVLVAACAAAQFVIDPRIDRRRADFAQLHTLSVACLGVAMLAALVIAISVAWRSHGHYSN